MEKNTYKVEYRGLCVGRYTNLDRAMSRYADYLPNCPAPDECTVTRYTPDGYVRQFAPVVLPETSEYRDVQESISRNSAAGRCDMFGRMVY